MKNLETIAISINIYNELRQNWDYFTSLDGSILFENGNEKYWKDKAKMIHEAIQLYIALFDDLPKQESFLRISDDVTYRILNVEVYPKDKSVKFMLV